MTEDPPQSSAERNPLADFGKVAGELVHDLANDMQVLHGWATLARVEAEQGVVPLDEIQRVDRLSETLGRMLQDVVATVAGQALSPEVVFDPRLLTESAVNDRLAEIVLAEVRFRARLPAGVMVMGRASFWIRIVSNLLRNAARHARTQVLVSVELDQLPSGREAVMLRVEDDGPGVPSDAEARVFEPLWRGASGGAAGLGLSSVAWSAEQLGGTAGYGGRSRLGGAVFEVRVPTARPILSRAREEADARSLCGVRLLLIDDDPSVRVAISRLLRRTGAEVKELDPNALPEEHLMRDVVSAVPDGILLDLNLNERGGVALWEHMRDSVPQLAERVLFISGSAPGDPIWEAAVQTGRPVLAKPFDVRELVGLVHRLRAGG